MVSIHPKVCEEATPPCHSYRVVYMEVDRDESLYRSTLYSVLNEILNTAYYSVLCMYILRTLMIPNVPQEAPEKKEAARVDLAKQKGSIATLTSSAACCTCTSHEVTLYGVRSTSCAM